MEIISVFDDCVFGYLTRYGPGHVTFGKNLSHLLPDNLLEEINAYDWDTVPNRNYNKFADILSKDELDKLMEFSLVKNWQCNINAQWKIINADDTRIDFGNLYSHIEQRYKKYKLWISRVDPGCCIPQHVDTIEAFVTDFKLSTTEINNIKRTTILPEDIKPWHHLWYGKDVITKKKAGDNWSFNFWEPHGGGNLGPSPKYTIQLIAV